MDQEATQQSARIASSQAQVQYPMASGPTAPYQLPVGGQQPANVPGVMAGSDPAFQVWFTHPINYSHLQQQQLQHFWATQMQEIDQVNDFKNHQLPLARIKKIMKVDEDVRMISAEAPVLFAKACEMFILELTLRSWIHRQTLQRNDIAAAITRTDVFDFLVDIVPRDELKEEGLSLARAGLPIGSPADAIPYGGMYYVAQPQPPGLASPVHLPPQNMVGSTGTFLGRSAMPVDPSMYAQQHRPNMPYFAQQQVWQQPEMPNASTGEQPSTSG